MINIVIVDDSKDSITALKRNINNKEDINVMATFECGKDVVKFCENAKPDLILMDIKMENMNGIEACKEIKSINPDIKIAYLTTYHEPDQALDALKSKNEGYIFKGHKTDKLISIIKNINFGFNVYENELSEMIEFKEFSEKDTSVGIEVLTERQKKIVALVTKGKTDTQIAKELFLSEGYVRNLLVKIRKKVGAKNSRELAVWGAKNDL